MADRVELRFSRIGGAWRYVAEDVAILKPVFLIGCYKGFAGKCVGISGNRKLYARRGEYRTNRNRGM